MNLTEEANKATELLKDKVVESVLRHNKNEIIIKFTDGTTLYVNKVQDGLDISIT